MSLIFCSKEMDPKIFVHVWAYWLTWQLFKILEFLSDPIHGRHWMKSCLNLEMTSSSVQAEFIIESVSLMAPVDFFINSFHRFLSVILQACSTASNQPSNLGGLHCCILQYLQTEHHPPSPGWNVSFLCMHPFVIAVPVEWNLKNETDFLPVGWLIFWQHHWPWYC